MGTSTFQKVVQHTHIAIVHDSIDNSVFQGQVLKPLQLYAKKNPEHHIVIISFEKKKIPENIIKNIIPTDFTFIQLKKSPFMGTWSLTSSIQSLKNTLKGFHNHSIIARGPIAGYLAHKALITSCTHIVIQARGLLAEEYGYTHSKKQTLIRKLVHTLRKRLYFSLEQETYSLQHPKISFEAVSPALRDYLVSTFDCHPPAIRIAQEDIPQYFSLQEKKDLRSKTRNKLKIDEQIYVYCYNGSAKAWQCPALIIEFFLKELGNNADALLLIISQDSEIFLALLKKYEVEERHYRIVSIPHQEVYSYLAAADAGLLFREPHIINWISRPTKALEYEALQLKIIHNNTVAYLVNKPR